MSGTLRCSNFKLALLPLILCLGLLTKFLIGFLVIYPPGQERETSNCNEKEGRAKRHGDAHAASDRMNLLSSVSRELNPNQVIRKIQQLRNDPARRNTQNIRAAEGRGTK